MGIDCNLPSVAFINRMSRIYVTNAINHAINRGRTLQRLQKLRGKYKKSSPKPQISHRQYIIQRVSGKAKEAAKNGDFSQIKHIYNIGRHSLALMNTILRRLNHTDHI